MKKIRYSQVLALLSLAVFLPLITVAAEASKKQKENIQEYIIAIISIGLVPFFFWVISKKDWTLLRDHASEEKLELAKKKTAKEQFAPYSLSRSQMAWWTFIVLVSMLYIWFTEKRMVEFTDQILVLLGISAGTTVTANYIDNKDLTDKNLKTRHQDSTSTNNFILNIISDQSGPSIHRFQNVLFSLAIGLYVLIQVLSTANIPELNDNLMVLMGISSSTYLAVKNGENKAYKAEIEQSEEIKKEQ